MYVLVKICLWVFSAGDTLFHFNFSPQHGTSSESACTKMIMFSIAQSIIFPSHSWRILHFFLPPEFCNYCREKKN